MQEAFSGRGLVVECTAGGRAVQVRFLAPRQRETLMALTKLLYFEDFTLLKFDSKVTDVSEENERTIIVLDQTVFYPQGGGQPYDKGVIENPSGKFLVEEVRFLEGTVKHIGTFQYA